MTPPANEALAVLDGLARDLAIHMPESDDAAHESALAAIATLTRLLAAADGLSACAEFSASALTAAGVDPNPNSDNPLSQLLHETLTALTAYQEARRG